MDPPRCIIKTLIMCTKLQIIGVACIVSLQIHRILANMKDEELQEMEEKSPVVWHKYFSF